MAEQLNEPLIKQGWVRAVVFFILYLLIAGGLFSILQQILPDKADMQKSADPISTEQNNLLLSISIMAVLTLGMIWLFKKFVDKQTLFSLGFTWRMDYGIIGALAAIAMLGIGTLILIATEHLSFIACNIDAGYLAKNLLLMVLVAIMEEVVFRGYLLNNLLQSMDKWLALGISAVLFTFFHTGNEGVSVLPLIEIFIGGIMLGTNYIFTRNLWFGISLHFVWNFLQGPVLGYKVSGNQLPSLLQQEASGPVWLTGGAFGFEGSVLAVGLNLLLIGVLSWIYKQQSLQTSSKLSS